MHNDPRKAAATQKNWDSYGGLPTSEEAIRTAEGIYWAPLSGGGLNFELSNASGSISCDIGKTGQIISFSFERQEGENSNL